MGKLQNPRGGVQFFFSWGRDFSKHGGSRGGRPPGSRPLPLLQLPRDPLLGLASAVAAVSSLAGAVYTLDQVTGVLLEVTVLTMM